MAGLESRRRGLERAHAVTRQLGAATGWHRPGAADWRLSGHQAMRAETQLERLGWRAQAVELAQGIALVEVRDLGVRWHPLVAVLRSGADVERFLAQEGVG